MKCSCTGKLLLGLVAMLALAPAAQAITIADARALPIGSTVTLTNVVLINNVDLIQSSTSKSIQAQDSTGGITIFGSNAAIDAITAIVPLGHAMNITGVTGSFNGLFQLVAPFSGVTDLGFVGVPAPTTISASALATGSPTAELLESTFVRINCSSFSASGSFAGVTNYTASDATGTYTVRIATTALDLVGRPIPGSPVDVIGILSQFDTTDPRDGDYQVLPIRYAALIDNPSCGATGACCVGTTCSIITGTACAGLGGVFQGVGSTCSPVSPCLPCTNIAGARAAGIGVRVRLCNVIVSSTTDLIASATSDSFQLQDSSGGITVFGSAADIADLLSNFAEGDSIDLEGTTGTFNGLFQLQGPFGFIRNNGFVGIPAPVVLTASALADGSPAAETYESMLVRVDCLQFAASGSFAATTNYIASDDTGSATVRIATAALDLVGWPIPSDPVNVVGILSQFDTTDPRDGGYQLLPRRQADFTPGVGCIPAGACCLGATCSIETPAACSTLGGVYQGDGTACLPFNPCVPATGACCLDGSMCMVLTADECDLLGGNWLGRDVPCAGTTCPKAVEAGDLILGLSNASRILTTEQIRGGALLSRFNAHTFAQSVEFDNHAGVLHNARGNLLALNFGAGGGSPGFPPTCSLEERPDEGGKVVSYATDGSDRGQLLYEFDVRNGGIACTRVSGLGVSTDNARLSMIGFDTGNLYVLDYSAGPAVGTGTGAAITGAREWRGSGGFQFAPANVSQGTTWFDSDTILAHIVDRTLAPGVTQLYTVDYNPVTMTFSETLRTTIFNDADISPGSRFTDVEYNPEVAPFIFCHFSQFVGSRTRNTLTVIDPTTWAVIKTLSLDGGTPISLETGRELALSPDLKLYISQFGSRVDVLNLDVVAPFGVITAADIAALTDDSTVDYYVSSTFASFNGIDVAFGSSCLVGDSNGDGLVNFDDISCFVSALVSESAWLGCGTTASNYVCTNDINGDGSVNFDDITGFVSCLVAGSCD